MLWALLAALPLISHQTPIFRTLDADEFINPFISSKFCVLPPELDSSGNVTFLEDCPALDRFDKVPKPAEFGHKVGVHTVVCCPRYIPPKAICFPSDPWCPTYEPPDYADYDYGNDTADYGGGSDYGDEYQYQYDDGPVAPTVVDLPKMADKSCNATLLANVAYLPGINKETNAATCTTINRCPNMVDNKEAPTTHLIPCGFDETEKLIMVCCPDEMVEEPDNSLKQAPRFPKGRKPRKCQDASKLCGKWKSNGLCDQDKDIIISEEDPYNGVVESKTMFDFMQTACPQTCDICGDKGCVDEHPRCQAWARAGMCVLAPFFMAHTCRESCGVCGFLSPTNKETQKNGVHSYSDFTADDFHCGRFKLLCEINNTTCEAVQEETTTEKSTTTTTAAPDNGIGADDFDLRSTDLSSSDIFFSSDPDPKRPGEFFCGATVVSDRWVVAASHCYDDFKNGVSDGPQKVRVNTIRDNTGALELVEIKRVYKHPEYRFPNLYNDVAVLELGRRIEYNFDKFGDSPSCLDQGIDITDKIATVQGYGTTETGDKGTLLETNVTVISNQQCKEILNFNVTDNNNNRKKILQALPLGLDYGLLCAQGIYNEEKNLYSGSCKGDSGGPLTQKDEQDRTTLIGIVSGGIDCGKGYPGWYTRVEYYKDWVQCIIDKSVQFNNNFKKVDDACKKIARGPREAPDCEKLVADPDVALFDLRGIDGFEPADICLPYKTGTFARADDEPKVDTEVFGETPSAGFSADEYDDYDGDDIFGGDDDIFGGGDDAAGGDDYDEDDIFGDR
jgi:hypothetical protein